MVDHITMVLPDDLKATLGYPYKRYMFFRYLRETFGDRFKPQYTGPMPLPALITTEALMHKDDLKIRAKPEWYFGSGFREAWAVLTMVEQYSYDLGSMRSVLEFDCGSARVLRHFRNIADLRLAETDANPSPIEWDCENLPGIDFYQNALVPPLAFDGESFDLIYALSVFTHIPLEWQRPWLNELRRVLRPGAYLLCTVLGNNCITSQLNERDNRQHERTETLTLDAKHPRASHSSQALGSWDVFQTRDQVRAAFGAGFDILCYTTKPAAAGQDVLILRKAA
jgi:SAM-dependent methyltransferase